MLCVFVGSGSSASGGPCTTCTIHCIECTYNDRLKVREHESGPSPPPESYPNPSHQGPEGMHALSESCRGSNLCSYIRDLEDRIANLERLLHKARSVSYVIHFSHPQQYSSQDCTDGSSSLSSGHTPTNPPVSGDRRSLGLLPASAYSKPEDMDPLSLPTEETSDSDGECFSLSETDLGTSRPMQGPTGEHTCRFHGKSSLLAFTNRAFNETGESPCPSRPHTYREEFWVTPDVRPSIW